MLWRELTLREAERLAQYHTAAEGEGKGLGSRLETCILCPPLAPNNSPPNWGSLGKTEEPFRRQKQVRTQLLWSWGLLGSSSKDK